MTLQEAKVYLDRMEANRDKDEPNNPRAYKDARNLAAWVSIAEHGSEYMQKQALRIIKSI